MNKNNMGLVHIYCGDGKGKSTAAFGLALRAYGNGFKILIAQFLKSHSTGEVKTFETLENIMILRSKKKFPFSYEMTNIQKIEIKNIHNNIFKEAVELNYKKKFDIIIFDELIGAYNLELIDKTIVNEFLKNKNFNAEIIITGRNPSIDFIECADYISEIKKIKHPFDVGINARLGIEM